MVIEELEEEVSACGQYLRHTAEIREEGDFDNREEEGDSDLCLQTRNRHVGVVNYDLHANPCAGVYYSSTLNQKGQKNAVNSQHLAVKLFVGAGARLLFYPTLFYNVVRNKFEADFRWWDEIEPCLLLGAVPFPKDVYRLKSLGVEAVVTLNESYETLVSSSLYKSQMIKHLVIPTRDYLFAPSFGDIERAVDFIHQNIEHGKATYVHCKAGRGRSTTIVLCYLVKYRGMTPFDAFNHVRSKRPRVQLAASQWKAVLRYNDYQRLRKDSDFPQLLSIHWPVCNRLQDGGGDYQISAPSDKSLCGESPVFVTASDLEGYEEREDDLWTSKELQGELGLAYKVGILTAKRVAGVAKASATLARLSYIWLGYQTESQAFNMTLSCSAVSDVASQSNQPMVTESQAFNMTLSCSAVSDVSSQSKQPMVALHVCQQGMVKC